MNTRYISKLEFHKVLEKLSTYCSTYLGRKLALNLQICNDANIVKQKLAETEEAVNIIYKNSTPSFYDIQDIHIYLINLESSQSLPIKGLLDLNTIFLCSRDLKTYFSKDYINKEDFPILEGLFSSLYTNEGIISKISSSIIDENTIDDKASPELQKIRKKIRNLEQDIRSKLNVMIHSSSFSKYVQENVVTIRNDRFVIPIKEEYRSQVKGFVHDVSNAGSTLFIEPISIFELNNEINQLRLEEEVEIEKILQQLTSLFYPYIEELKTDVEVIGTLDFIFAKAKYSKAISGITPIINTNKEIHLINARHPLIDKNKVVPISIELGKDFSTLLITGPNTGGKTVTLKTVGLLTCMACSGLNIPADEKSSIFVFEHIFADIGDDQSIADSLSTFSSHMTNIVNITKHANENSLILVDELGSGTDPVEGANLAISILDYFKTIGALTIATTHYQELKKYAMTSSGFENASVEFDVETLSPTYKLLIGVPGKSNAFEISQKLGLDISIIQKAKDLMSSNDITFEELLKNIYDDKQLIEKEKEKILADSEQINNLKEKLQRENLEKEKQEKEIINNAKVKARNILLEAKEDANEMIKQLSDVKDSKKIHTLRNTLNEKIKDIQLEPTISENTSPANSLSKEEIKPGKEVFVTSLNQNGLVLSNVSRNNEVQVQIGSMKLNVKLDVLQNSKTLHNANSTKNMHTSSHISKSRNIKPEINVIGMNIEEANFVIDKFLDDCALAKLETVRIIHGKGTGKLKNGIHQFLKNNSHVKSFRLGTFGEGEMGVTVVTLK